MKPEAQRIAIAEACGWKNQGRAKGVPALNHRWVSPNGTVGDYVPLYDKDLNAMHKAEKVLEAPDPYGICENIDEPEYDYSKYLKTVCGHNWTWKATAAQRAEAFLRTIGKWTDSN